MIECKFITNGISVKQDHVLRPCCNWKFDNTWAENNSIETVKDLTQWHSTGDVLEKKQLLDQDIWPDNCRNCSVRELAGNFNNVRHDGNNAYSHYGKDDITLEIRPGSICNFACQTCWPEASTRVSNYQYKAGIINQRVKNKSIDNFDFLKPISHRIRDVILLGGEPFYDKNCKKFLQWSLENLNAKQLIYTNGLVIDYDFLKNYQEKITLIFSLDAVGKPAEYIRMGTKWNQVWKNYQTCKQLDNVEVRVQVTTSVYNYAYLTELIELLSTDWPEIIQIGAVRENYLVPKNIPLENRKKLMLDLANVVPVINKLDIPEHQKQHVLGSVKVIVNQLKVEPFDEKSYNQLKKYIQSMDRVKNMRIQDFCPKTVEYLSLNG